jgi:hypothetical protein
MNDLQYINYKASRMLLDTLAMPRLAELAHRRLCDYIWAVGELPPDDNDFLRQHTKIDVSEWGKVRVELMDKGWFVCGKHLKHNGVVSTYNAAQDSYVANYNRTSGARQSSPLICVTHPETGLVTYRVTEPVTGRVTEGVTGPHRKLKGKLSTKSPPPLGASAPENEGVGAQMIYPEIPTEDQAVAMTQTAGIPEEFTRHVYAKWAARAGKDGAGVLVAWLPHVTGRWKNEQVEWNNGTHRGNRKDQDHGKANSNRSADRNQGTYNSRDSAAELSKKVR